MRFCLKIIVNLVLLFNLKLGVYTRDGSESNHVGVVGGSPASIEDFPFLVSIWKNGVLHCGGAIVTRTYILTAAHCVRDKRSFIYSVLVGTSDLQNEGESYNVETIIKHGKYKSGRDYDIGLLRIHGTLSFSDKVAPAQLPDKAVKFTEGTVFNITGWGDIEWGGTQSRTLMRTLVPWVDGTTCRHDYKGIVNITIRMFCAGSEGHDACQGDSGGPLTLNGLVVGVTSGGKFCGWRQYPSIYTKVSRFRTWIRNVAHITDE